jgi:hypothetical protein
MPGTPTTTATLRDNRLFVQYRRRERVDANTTDTSTLARLPLDVISNALSYLPSRQLTNVVKNVNARYKELAMPLLTKRLFWLERELAHDMWELVSEYDYIAGRSTAGPTSRTRRRSSRRDHTAHTSAHTIYTYE